MKYAAELCDVKQEPEHAEWEAPVLGDLADPLAGCLRTRPIVVPISAPMPAASRTIEGCRGSGRLAANSNAAPAASALPAWGCIIFGRYRSVCME